MIIIYNTAEIIMMIMMIIIMIWRYDNSHKSALQKFERLQLNLELPVWNKSILNQIKTFHSISELLVTTTSSLSPSPLSPSSPAPPAPPPPWQMIFHPPWDIEPLEASTQTQSNCQPTWNGFFIIIVKKIIYIFTFKYRIATYWVPPVEFPQPPHKMTYHKPGITR